MPPVPDRSTFESLMNDDYTSRPATTKIPVPR